LDDGDVGNRTSWRGSWCGKLIERCEAGFDECPIPLGSGTWGLKFDGRLELRGSAWCDTREFVVTPGFGVHVNAT
jgi:hypothetical protein